MGLRYSSNMQPLNAIDSVAPAFTRTHETLFHPFRYGRSWKLAASSYLGFMGSMFLPFPLLVFLLPSIPGPVSGPMHTALLKANLLFTVLGVIILYFCARMEMVVFEMVVTRGKFIAPMWRRYSARVWSWIGLKIVVGTVFTLLVVAVFFAPMKHLIEAMIASFDAGAGLTHGVVPNPDTLQPILGPMLAQWATLQFALLGILLLLKVPSTLLNDFVLPFFVLEDMGLVAAIVRAWSVFRADPGQVILYLILKPILFFIGYIIQSVSMLVVLIPVVIVAGVGTAFGGLSVRHGGAGAGLFLLAAGVVFGVAAFVFLFYASVGMFGYQLTLLEAYGVYFLAGRYTLLGDLLEPGPGKPFTPPPVFPSDEERENDSGGPPMPMNPAVA